MCTPPDILLLSVASHSVGYPMGQFGAAVLVVSPLYPLFTPTHSLWGWEEDRVGKRESLGIVEALFSSSQQVVINTVLSTNAKQIILWATMRKVKPIPARPSTQVYRKYSKHVFNTAEFFIRKISQDKVLKSFIVLCLESPIFWFSLWISKNTRYLHIK